jgi:hypothetical protein
MRPTRIILLTLALGGAAALAAPSTLAQESASHRLEEHVFNAGGHPMAGVHPSSASHQLTIGSIGDPFGIGLLTGPASTLQFGFVLPYAPPAEVLDVMFTHATTLVWDPRPHAAGYNIYRGLISTLPGLAYGSCLQQGVVPTTTIDATLPAPGTGFFYLVTMENGIAEEGTKGFASSGAQRAGSACP